MAIRTYVEFLLMQKQDRISLFIYQGFKYPKLFIFQSRPILQKILHSENQEHTDLAQDEMKNEHATSLNATCSVRKLICISTKSKTPQTED